MDAAATMTFTVQRQEIHQFK